MRSGHRSVRAGEDADKRRIYRITSIRFWVARCTWNLQADEWASTLLVIAPLACTMSDHDWNPILGVRTSLLVVSSILLGSTVWPTASWVRVMMATVMSRVGCILTYEST